ncbi:DUF6215 domain-containing protein [Streptomyces sp. NPDC096324]|uniref:DUF6215 domain-containing protein n=1 Tax=Streptomyces sp. NPDC096324 TaxID=3366085 RepID=UPI00380FFDF5
MLGFLIRLLPFWVREPLLIVVCSVFGVRIMYLAVTERDLVAAGLGSVFLLFAAISVRGVVRALRARRNPSPAVSAGGATVDAVAHAQVQPQAALSQAAVHPQPLPQPLPQAQAGTGSRPGAGASKKDHNAWAQAVGAVALFGALGAILWLGPRFMPSEEVNATPPASCSDETHEEPPKVYNKKPQPVTGEELCNAVLRPDLAMLLGTPGEKATSASGSDNTAPLTDGKVAQPEARIDFDTYTVNVSATYNDLSIDQYVKLMKYGDESDVKTVKVRGRSAVFSTDHTMKIEINLGGDGGSGGPVGQGPLERTLSVALDRGDRGGYCEITVWSESGALPSDTALLSIAEKVLPKIPERPAR